MYSYSLGLLVGKHVQHTLKVSANSAADAQEIWAIQKNVHKSDNWNHEAKTYQGHQLICFETDDPRVTVKFKLKQKPGSPSPKPAIPQPAEGKPEGPGADTTLGPDDAGGVSINLEPPKEVPDLRFQQTWHQDPDEKPKKNVGFDDDKPI